MMLLSAPRRVFGAGMGGRSCPRADCQLGGGGRGRCRILIHLGASEAFLSPLPGVWDTNALPWHL